MARNSDETVELAALGAEGDVCASCGTELATDQRYCLNCGAARAEPRLDFQKHLGSQANGSAPAPPTAATPAGPVPATANAVPIAVANQPQWTPAMAIGAIAVLGVMLLLGVLIGKEDGGETVAAAPVTTTTAEPVETATADPAAADPAAKEKDATAKAAGGGKTASGGVQGGSGSTEGISTDNPLEGLTGEELQEAQKNAPDVVATEGEALPTDNKPAGGGSGGGACIGC